MFAALILTSSILILVEMFISGNSTSSVVVLFCISFWSFFLFHPAWLNNLSAKVLLKWTAGIPVLPYSGIYLNGNNVESSF